MTERVNGAVMRRCLRYCVLSWVGNQKEVRQPASRGWVVSTTQHHHGVLEQTQLGR